MTRDTLRLTTLAALILAVPTLSLAQLSEGDMLGKTEAEIRASVEATGAEIDEIETEEGVIEVEYELEGMEYEVTVELASGTIIKIERDDDDEADDND